MSFLEVLARAAGSIKSGGTTRRAAKMVILDVDHPEVEDFIQWKVNEEKKVAALIAGGFSADFNGEAYHTVSGQNANNTIRVTDEFMDAVLKDKDWDLRARTSGEVIKTVKARDLWRQIATAAWACADPGMQYDTTINDWHTSAGTDRINASNPCSEFMFLDDTACKLASLNLMKFVREDQTFDVEAYVAANRIVFMAQEFLVGFSSYPTKVIAQNSYDYRPIGLGYANLGTLLMTQGHAYDSAEGREIAGAITSIMNAVGYRTSAELAAVLGPFRGFEKNREPMLKVMEKHRQAADRLDETLATPELAAAARRLSAEMVEMGQRHGYRNAQATVLAPTGTIGLLMDCDTTGVEPDFALVKFKKLAGGGYFKIINESVEPALVSLGYDAAQRRDIMTSILGTLHLVVPMPKGVRGAQPGQTFAQWLRGKGLTEDDLGRITKSLRGVRAGLRVRALGDRRRGGQAAGDRPRQGQGRPAVRHAPQARAQGQAHRAAQRDGLRHADRRGGAAPPRRAPAGV